MILMLFWGCEPDEDDEPCPSETGGDVGAYRIDVSTSGVDGDVAVLNQLEIFHTYEELNAWWTSVRSDDVAELDFSDAQAVAMVTAWSYDSSPEFGVRLGSFVWSAGGPPILARMEEHGCVFQATDYNLLWEVWSTPVAEVEVCGRTYECADW